MKNRWMVVACFALACAPAGGEANGESDTVATAEETADEATADTTLPAAILGTAPPPRGEEVRYVEGDSSTVGYVATPDGPGSFPAVILIHEWNGLVDRVRQTADALADEGYVALAADLYHGRTGDNREENMALVREARDDPDAMIANLDAAVAWLKEKPYVTGRVGAVGWCFGGGVALSFGLDGAEHEATAVFYGSLIEDPDRLAALDHEVYGTFAELDDGIPPERVEAFAAALDAAGVENDIHVYDGVDHGFWLYVDEDPEARTEAARDAWRRLRGYFARTLGD
ncbi:MAG: dienelactone hydrolase family protein [Gemmatimonadota bacterium]